MRNITGAFRCERSPLAASITLENEVLDVDDHEAFGVPDHDPCRRITIVRIVRFTAATDHTDEYALAAFGGKQEIYLLLFELRELERLAIERVFELVGGGLFTVLFDPVSEQHAEFRFMFFHTSTVRQQRLQS